MIDCCGAALVPLLAEAPLGRGSGASEYSEVFLGCQRYKLLAHVRRQDGGKYG